MNQYLLSASMVRRSSECPKSLTLLTSKSPLQRLLIGIATSWT
ncbi:hypothetical protein EG68_01521 [Paragonimus skrjabini miyazakii]|uniref:Uncharacterized protein n=1 Tax=Paragonimus skrjabini miyazakii TaxID=59628 RepID=A0A8S9Z7X6_9TREM|nr:hypothetical protein EG68_01521 [Paragonimus skrjabini miyazakii]